MGRTAIGGGDVNVWPHNAGGTAHVPLGIAVETSTARRAASYVTVLCIGPLNPVLEPEERGEPGQGLQARRELAEGDEQRAAEGEEHQHEAGPPPHASPTGASYMQS